MTLNVFLDDLRGRGVQLWLEGDRLRCSAPEGVLTPELRTQLQQRKPEILAFLKEVDAVAHQQPAIVPLQPLGQSAPMFAVAGHNGDVFAYRTLAQELGKDQPFYGLQPPGLDGASEALTSVDALATYFADQVQASHPDGPYILAGFCAGGTIAYEVARTLRERGATVPLLVMFASPWPSAFKHAKTRERWQRLGVHLTAMLKLGSPVAMWKYLAGLRGRLQAEQQRSATERAEADQSLIRRGHVEDVTLNAVRNHTPHGRFDGRLLMVLPGRAWPRGGFKPLRWRKIVGSTDEYYGTTGEMGVMLRGPDTAGIAHYLAKACAEAVNGAGASPNGRYDPKQSECAESSASSISNQTHPPLVTSR